MKPCKLWQGLVDNKGYGLVTYEGKNQLAHRVEYCKGKRIHLSEIKGKVVRHKCDTPLCVERTHLLLGTQLDNIADAVARGRMERGEARYNSKLTEANIRYIRAECVKGGRGTAARMCREFDVNHVTIHRIIHNKMWRHVCEQ